MVHHILWRRASGDKQFSPFIRGADERPLRLILHSDSFKQLTGDSASAAALLYLHAGKTHLEVVDTRRGSLPWVEFEQVKPDANFITVVRYGPNGHRAGWTGVPLQGRLDELMQGWRTRAEVQGYSAARADELWHEWLIFRSSKAIGTDVLVTASDWLLRRMRETEGFRNIMNPIEALKLVGLFLRSRQEYGVYRSTIGTDDLSISRGQFYSTLADSLLPSVSTALVLSRNAGPAHLRADVENLHRTAAHRFRCALEARDSILTHYYAASGWDRSGWIHDGWSAVAEEALDQMLYHFDYLALLLLGALDALALAAYHMFEVVRFRPRLAQNRVGIRSRDLHVGLKMATARALSAILNARKFEWIVSLIAEPRNTIHKEAIALSRAVVHGDPERSGRALQVTLPPTAAGNIRAAVQGLGFTLADWGMRNHHNGAIELDLASYSCALVTWSARAIERVERAFASDMRRVRGVTVLKQPQPLTACWRRD